MYKEQPDKITSPMYLSYMVRLWRSANSREWLASLEAPGTRVLHNFSDLASFFAFLQAQTGTEQAAEGSSEEPETKDRTGLRLEPP